MGVVLPDFLLCSLFPVQQTTSGVGDRVKYFFGLATNTLNVRNNYGGCSEGLDAFLEAECLSMRVDYRSLWLVVVHSSTKPHIE